MYPPSCVILDILCIFNVAKAAFRSLINIDSIGPCPLCETAQEGEGH